MRLKDKIALFGGAGSNMNRRGTETSPYSKIHLTTNAPHRIPRNR